LHTKAAFHFLAQSRGAWGGVVVKALPC